MILTTPTAECIKWRAGILKSISILKTVIENELTRLDKKAGYVLANRWLGRVNARLTYCDQYITDLSGEDLAKWAERVSRDVEIGIAQYSTKQGAGAVRAFLKEQATMAGALFDDWEDSDKVNALMLRMVTPEWWKRQAKRQWIIVEQILRECGQVHRHASPYASSWALNKFRQQLQNNRAFLEGWEAVNDLGQSYTLAQLSEKGISNPKNRKAELMVRIRGFEEMAAYLGHESYFITITCPSKYHPISNGRRNRKYLKADCPTVRDAHAYLNGVWKRFRAYCKNHGIPFYGLRTVEPHHDGCPHWHLITFVKPENAAHFLSAFRAYAMEEDGKERGAAEHRFTVVKIDPSKGTAAGYAAKYVAKNIDGEDIDTDFETGRSGKDAAQRITAWARLNRIRQFQFFGGASVTVWRELRRLGVNAAPKAFPDIYHAANRADWSKFVTLMGGVFAGRNQTLKPHYSEPEPNQFGEMVASIKGVCRAADVVVTRLYEWTVQRVGTGSLALENGAAVPWTCVNNCTRGSSSPPYQPNYQP
ncbi:replication endonuclease [Marinomonas transparens]|uniref:Replication endonuclease n=1 Tax=Marinomonas transparens TaxID=2795388 RepID=A0A934N7P1_9GAMM|nr:replication endonuclease [Marinomonas transparens]MBJ7539261.1 replication endonuclease [Marinomonas transparens]